MGKPKRYENLNEKILEVLQPDKPISTNEIAKHFRFINWVTIHNRLVELENENKAKKILIGNIIAWQKI